MIDPNPSPTSVKAPWSSSWLEWWWLAPTVATSASSVVPLIAVTSLVVLLVVIASSGVPLVMVASAGMPAAVMVEELVLTWRGKVVAIDSPL